MQHMMIDLETWGTAPGSAIRSIGAAMFDPFAGAQRNATSPSFYCNVSDESCKEFGLTRDLKTEAWWAKPEKAAAQAHLYSNQLPLEAALASLEQFWHETRAVYVWSYGANFDVVLLEEAIRRVNKTYLDATPEGYLPKFQMALPWSYKNVRCHRTLVALAGLDQSAAPSVGVLHNALDDARTQINMAAAAYHRLRISQSPDVMAARDPKPEHPAVPDGGV